MAKPILDVIENTKELYMTDSALDTMLDFERVIDELDLYAFKNWKLGELVEGPSYEKYFVTCTFMWPHKLMPDPRGGERLLDYGCEITYAKDYLEYPVKVKSPDDFQPGGKMPKMAKTPVWLVAITMPKKLMQEINQGSLELEGASLDLEDIENAYEEGIDQAEVQDQDELQAQDMEQQGLGNEPAPTI